MPFRIAVHQIPAKSDYRIRRCRAAGAEITGRWGGWLRKPMGKMNIVRITMAGFKPAPAEYNGSLNTDVYM